MINNTIFHFIYILLSIYIIQNVNATEYNLCNDGNGNEGFCLDTTTCDFKKGKSIDGKCPNESANVKCCINIPKSNTPFVKGIDVADYQKDIQWDKVKNADVEFVIMRATLAYSETTECYVDEKFEEYYKGALSIDLKRGAYFYTHATSNERMKMDVDYFVEAVKDKTFQYPFFIDVETENQKNMGKKEFTDMIIYGAELIREKTNNHTVGVYTTVDYYKNYIEESRITENGIKKWFAQYSNYDFDPAKHDLSDLGEFWQYTNLSRVDGIPTEVDANVHYTNNCSCLDANDNTCNCDNNNNNNSNNNINNNINNNNNNNNNNTSNTSKIVPTLNIVVLLLSILFVRYFN